MPEERYSTFELRSARISDAVDLGRNCFPEQAPEEVESYLCWCLTQQGQGRIVRLVAEADGQVVANGQLTIRRDQGEIGSLVVARPYRRRGIGTALLKALIREACQRRLRTVEITARTDVAWVQAWYQRLGFVFDREHTFPGDDQVAVLRLSLGEPIQ